jgi:cation diffusion facilitator CzcD-associated flavoprotein CzcO
MGEQESQRKPSVVVIGAGMTGILMAIKLQQAGIRDVTILEKTPSLGGTWRENTYPGVACDVPSHMYSYSFSPNPEWARRFAPGEEIRQYFDTVARSYGIAEQVRYNEAVTQCHYSDGRWQIATSKGAQITADFVICATGILHHPAYPDIPGLQDFAGACFHTARWDDSVPLSGKRVGIIGTGSTACQIIPELQQQVAQLTVFQRTPQWVAPQPNPTYSEKIRQRLRSNPRFAQRVRARHFRFFEQVFSKAVIGKPIPHLLMSMAAKWNLYWQVRNRQLRHQLTPDYKVGCKRLIFSSRFYPAIQQPNVHLETNGIERIEPDGVRSKDGQLHKLDALVLSTGFHPFNFMRPMDLRGRNGISIDQAWRQKVQAYRSLCLPEFPNFFLMLGPNTPIGNYSVIEMSEVQGRYVMQLIDAWRKRQLDTVEATHAAKKRFNSYLRAGMSKTVWVGGCTSWYLDADGDPALWPYTWQQWKREMAEPDFADFLTAAATAQEHPDAQETALATSHLAYAQKS